MSSCKGSKDIIEKDNDPISTSNMIEGHSIQVKYLSFWNIISFQCWPRSRRAASLMLSLHVDRLLINYLSKIKTLAINFNNSIDKNSSIRNSSNSKVLLINSVIFQKKISQKNLYFLPSIWGQSFHKYEKIKKEEMVILDPSYAQRTTRSKRVGARPQQIWETLKLLRR